MYEHDATEQAFKNGANYMRTLVLTMLSDLKSTALGKDRFILSIIMDKINKLEVRV
jgi:hypothetical protein